MKITTLVENHTHSSQPQLSAEHGLSFYIEHKGQVFMSDVGQTDKFAENAAVLGVDLAKVEALAISHHHYDHGGGLAHFFEENAHAIVYLHESPDVDYVGFVPGQEAKYIGLDKSVLRENTSRIVYVSQTCEILSGLHLITPIPYVYPKPSGDQRLKIRSGNQMRPDTFEHEIVTMVEDEEGIVVMTGCAHNGVLNMIAVAQDAFPEKPIKAVIGGFHLSHEEDETVREIGEKLLEMELPRIVTGHCTGDAATDILHDVLGERLQRLYTGLVMEL